MGNTLRILEARRLNHLNRGLRQCIKLLAAATDTLDKIERNTLADSLEKEMVRSARISLIKASRQIESIEVPRVPANITSIA